jgi:hypothetical protein
MERMMKQVSGGPILDTLVTATSTVVNPWASEWSVQATVTGTGAVTATVSVQVSNDASGWIEIEEIALSDTTLATDAITVTAAWKYVRCVCSAITGTGARLIVTFAGQAA